jgi:hypothetical protein
MFAPWLSNNIGAALVAVPVSVADEITAAGTGDNTEVECEIVDLVALGNPQSCKIVFAYETTLTAAKTLTLAFDVDHGADSGLSDAAVYDAGMTATVLETGAQTAAVDSYEYDLDLAGAKQYLRVQYTPDLTHSGTDTVKMSCVIVFGGFSEIPATESS